ncbi:hypothetical protein JKP88DRAFT_267622 [Tribonema minus]|uniref:Zn(2)-C6 fungal-type domain-containing protein n=1 Tax=Tribonema minus TaxID=303371 RepID=A0A836CK64_9STRA|nr:hypothetical protein JKP88DRAFT_267622 [Tribonema minus]
MGEEDRDPISLDSPDGSPHAASPSPLSVEIPVKDEQQVVNNASRKKRVYSPPTAPSNSEDENMRSACDSCTFSKIRCVGGRPCERCRKRGKDEKRRCGPKKKEDGSSSPSRSGGGSFSRPGEYSVNHVPSTFDATSLNAAEKEWLRQFVLGLNAYLPVVNEGMLTLAVRPLPSGAVEIDRHRRHACRAALWGSVSLGALVCKNEAEGARYNQRARLELKECFDAPVTELTSVFLVLTIYYLHRLDNAKLVRYAGFARQSLRELAFIPLDIAASVRMLQVSLYLAGAGEPPEVTVPTPRTMLHLPPSVAKQRCLHIISFLMMSIYTSIRPDDQRPFGTVPIVSDEHLLSLAGEIRGLVECTKAPDDMSVVIGCVLQGYLLLRLGHTADAIRISETVAEMVAMNPTILQFPLTWTMSCCVLEGLRRFGRHAVAEKLIATMSPLAAGLPFASKCCSVGAELLAVYAGNGCGMAQALQIQQLQQKQAFQQQQAAAAAAAAVAAAAAATSARSNSAASVESDHSGGGGRGSRTDSGLAVPHHLSAGHQSLDVLTAAAAAANAAVDARLLAQAELPELPPYAFTTGFFNATQEVMAGMDTKGYMASLLAASGGGPGPSPHDLPFADLFRVGAH